MAEKDMRGRVIKALRPVDGRSVENWVGPGTPDVNFIEGWVELKWCRSWPVKPETPVKLDHYTKQQKVWQMRRHLKHGRIFVLLQIGVCWMLFDVPTAIEILGVVDKATLLKLAWKVWPKGLKDKELIEWLCHRPLPYHRPQQNCS